MVANNDLLMSFHEEFAEAILRKDKTVEVRRRPPRVLSGTTVWMYATSPCRAVIGWFEAGEAFPFSAARVPRQVRTDAHVTPAALRKYLRGASMGYGIPVVRCKRLRRPVHLPDGQRGPMSYRYLTTGDARLIRALRRAA
jgi:predicted transcriptional regulator